MAGRVRRQGWGDPARHTANLVRALAFGLVDPDERERVSSDLVKVIRNAGTTLGTGFLATPFLLPVLADHGHHDVAFDLLLQTPPPSWLHMIEAGATTIWENWEGLIQNGSGSLNHYSKGAVVSFLHQYVAGLRPIGGVPAYRRFEVKPVLGGGLGHRMPALTHHMGPLARRGSSRAKHSLWKSWRHPAPKLT